jgi:hypothetical protein
MERVYFFACLLQKGYISYIELLVGYCSLNRTIYSATISYQLKKATTKLKIVTIVRKNGSNEDQNKNKMI